MSRKFALVIGNTQYEDPKLGRLASPASDVNELAELLGSESLGQFDDVTRRVNLTSSDANKEIERFFRVDKYPDDLLLFYFSGHGVLDDMSELYFACSDTDMQLLDSTAVSATYLRKAMGRSRSRRVVLVLDCCNSGAFGQGAKAALGSSVGTQQLVADVQMPKPGEGRIALTASDETGVAWEGEAIVGQPQQSIFTQVLLEGLRTGDADLDCDGWIAIDELYQYLDQNVGRRSNQRPKKFGDVQGQFYIGRRQPGTLAPVKLDARIAEDLQSEYTSVRLDAVKELGRWLHSQHIGKILCAEQELGRVARTDDSDRVKAAAASLLAQSPTEEELDQPGERRVASGEMAPSSTASLGKDEGATPDSSDQVPPGPHAPAVNTAGDGHGQTAGWSDDSSAGRIDEVPEQKSMETVSSEGGNRTSAPPADRGYGTPAAYQSTIAPPGGGHEGPVQPGSTTTSHGGGYGAPPPHGSPIVPPGGGYAGTRYGSTGVAPGSTYGSPGPYGAAAPVLGQAHGVLPHNIPAVPQSDAYASGWQPPAQPAAGPKTTGRRLARASLIFGIVAIFLAVLISPLGIVTGVVGVIVSVIALWRARSGSSVVGIILAGVGIVIGIVVYVSSEGAMSVFVPVVTPT
jgi:uncharacterized caspase-like protein